MEYRIHISKGNNKLGCVENISFPPVITCRKNAPCASTGCYALKLYKMYSSCRRAWDENLEYYKNRPHEFFMELDKALKSARYFRWFVSGDIPDESFFAAMVDLANNNEHCDMLCFTKQFEIVNKFCQEYGRDSVPKNLHILFSGWEGLKVDNPYNFPTTEVITPDMESVPDNWKICGGNCTECVCRGIGCWEAKSGDVIAFHKH